MIIDISVQDVSDAFWQRLVRKYQGKLNFSDRKYPYVERSIPVASVAALTILCEQAQPKTVIEIGTGVGRSTRVFCNYADDIATCDIEDQGAEFNDALTSKVTHFKKTGSTDMLKALPMHPVDLIFVDGRLQDADLHLIRDRIGINTVIALDDCESIEKGTVNALMLTGFFPGTFYIPPPSIPLFNLTGIEGKHTIGLVVQGGTLTVARQ